LGPEETDTRLFMLVLVVFRSPSDARHLVGGAGLGVRAGPASIPHLSFLPWVFGVGVSGGLVVVWVGVRSCFENCIVNASIL
jgi:hypothetical protein